ncbi:epimerase EvaD [Micromonospora carbonacea]|uniref:dTDP-4-dehydro-6-deoxyglucose 3-epimerase n=1 Tax=Micromonospora carbonacea TaxID=47853 RepID=A0A7H9DNI8_9ACTN|nr:dTDP-4-dehydrorhamnose 3,5-epimerase family protein [Micromonospora carbonacea]MBB5828972.1 epimerase EvaD [Micromonospora carbonacea]QLL25664.1 dTDP-4-dehydro-6-deoxyglucose 3-epimerase [Micromonospora carbonacea]
MQVATELAVEGAYVFTPRVFPDPRGVFVSPYLDSVFTETLGYPLFPVAQTSYSVSRRGVVRGLHYTTTPPGSAKFVSCPYGRVLDVVLDVRVGSPTFGRWDSVVLDSQGFRSLYLPTGVAHMFVALMDDTVMSYLLSTEYVFENERALSPLDDTLGLPVPADIEPILSDRDRTAITFAQAHAAGVLPRYEICAEIEARFAQGPHRTA